MKAAVVTVFGTPPRFTSFEDPIAAADEKLVRVTAAALPPLARGVASGTHYSSYRILPFVPGVDGVGTLADGTRVYFQTVRPPFGSFAEYSVAKNPLCIPLPAKLSDIDAAGMANAAMSSCVGLTFRAKLVAGESVLILGATGMAGRLAIQIAKRLGARRVVGAARNRKELAELAELGADATISLDQEREALENAVYHEAVEFGIDIVLDYLCGVSAEATMEALARKGSPNASSRVRYVQVGDTAGKTITLTGALLRKSGLEILGTGIGSAMPEQIRGALADFFVSAAEKSFKFHIQVAPLQSIEAIWNSPTRGARLVFQP